MVYDLHNDLPTSGLNGKEALYRAKNFPVRGAVLAVWTTATDVPETVVARARRWLDELPYSASLGIEDCGFLAGKSVDVLNGPVRYVSLTWNEDNRLAGGALGTGRLTGEGRRLIDEFTAAGTCIDLAHLNERSFYDVIDYCGGRAKLLCSHTALRSLNPHPRNLTDLQIRALTAAGGIVGLAAVESFIACGRHTGIDAYVKHLLTCADTFGADAPAIGTDFYGTEPIRGLEFYCRFADVRKRLEPHLKPQTIDKILYKNAEKFFSREIL